MIRKCNNIYKVYPGYEYELSLFCSSDGKICLTVDKGAMDLICKCLRDNRISYSIYSQGTIQIGNGCEDISILAEKLNSMFGMDDEYELIESKTSEELRNEITKYIYRKIRKSYYIKEIRYNSKIVTYLFVNNDNPSITYSYEVTTEFDPMIFDDYDSFYKDTLSEVELICKELMYNR